MTTDVPYNRDTYFTAIGAAAEKKCNFYNYSE